MSPYEFEHAPANRCEAQTVRVTMSVRGRDSFIDTLRVIVIGARKGDWLFLWLGHGTSFVQGETLCYNIARCLDRFQLEFFDD